MPSLIKEPVPGPSAASGLGATSRSYHVKPAEYGTVLEWLNFNDSSFESPEDQSLGWFRLVPMSPTRRSSSNSSGTQARYIAPSLPSSLSDHFS
jgi:hypothetical protein